MSQQMLPWTVVTLSLCVILLFIAGPTAVAEQQLTGQHEREPAATTQQATGPTGHPTENVTRRLRLSFSSGSDRATVTVLVAYPARSESEATAADNGTLNTSWYDAGQLVQRIHNHTAASDGTLTTTDESVTYEETSWAGSSGNPQAEHGWVILRYERVWESFVTPGEEFVIDETYSQVLRNSSMGSEWEFQVVAPAEWETTTVGGDPVTEPTGQTATRYRWDSIQTVSGPFLVFEAPLTTSTSGDGSLGPTGGLLITVVTLLFVSRYTR